MRKTIDFETEDREKSVIKPIEDKWIRDLVFCTDGFHHIRIFEKDLDNNQELTMLNLSIADNGEVHYLPLDLAVSGNRRLYIEVTPKNSLAKKASISFFC